MREKPANELDRSTLLTVFAVLFFGFPIGSYFLGASRVIEIGNLVMSSLWCGIAVAYSPSVIDIAKYRRLDGAMILSVSTFFVAVALCYWTLGAMTWRWFGRPPEWVDSVVRSYYIPVVTAAAICKMLAPQAVNGRIPTLGWIKLGAYVAAGFLCFGLVVHRIFD